MLVGTYVFIVMRESMFPLILSFVHLFDWTMKGRKKSWNFVESCVRWNRRSISTSVTNYSPLIHLISTDSPIIFHTLVEYDSWGTRNLTLLKQWLAQKSKSDCPVKVLQYTHGYTKVSSSYIPSSYYYILNMPGYATLS